MAEKPYTTIERERQSQHDGPTRSHPRRIAMLRLPAVKERTGLSRSTIYRKMDRAEFPKPLLLSQRAVGWLEADIDAWLASVVAGGANDQ